MTTQNPLEPSGEDAAFAGIADIARQEAGLALHSDKRSMLEARLACRLHRLGLKDYQAYHRFLCSPRGREERHQLVIALTTKISHFFREPHHFHRLRTTILPPLLNAAKHGGRIRFWSAGCAYGQEAYTLAMTVLDLLPDAHHYDLRILATDIDTNAIQEACSGRFSQTYCPQIPAPSLAAHTKASGPDFDMSDQARHLIRFRQHNLHSAWPMRQGFDVILCRNVLIYFDSNAQLRLLERFAAALNPGGWLFLGHSERVAGPAQYGLQPAGDTAYLRKNCPGRRVS